MYPLSAEGDLALGLLCLKVTIPRDLDPRQQQSRWGLFGGDHRPPKLRSIPALYSLSGVPTLLGSPRPPQRLAAAVALLNLKPSAYPPIALGPTSQRPVVDVSATTGQVYVVLEESNSPPRRSAPPAGTPGSPATTAARSEWLIIMEVELPIQVVKHPSGTDEAFQVSLSLPRCLDNTISFQVVPRDPLSDRVEIASVPPVISSQASTVKRGYRRSSVQSGIEDGWEDGEVPGVLDALSDDSESDYEAKGNQFDGRFQSTDLLQLEWRFLPSVGSPPNLRIVPQWDSHRPLISMAFRATLPATPGPVVLESVLPPGWGWSELEITGEGLLSWRSTDGEGWIVLESGSTVDPDESTATIDAQQRTPLRQTGLPPGLDSADFSFELNSFDSPSPRKPVTPGRRRPPSSERAAPELHRVVPRSPTPASVFQLEFMAPEDDGDERTIDFEGSIAPLNLTLVSPGAQVQIPFVRFDDLSFPTKCTVTCPQASFVTNDAKPDQHTSSASSETTQTCDATLPSIGVFNWTQDGQPLPVPSPVTIPGPVQVTIQRNVWAVQTVSSTFAWPANVAEVGARFPGSSVRVVRATSNDTHLPRAVLPLPNDLGTEVRVGRGRGSVELVVEVVSGDAVAVPSFSHGKGDLLVELVGSEWDNLLSSVAATNLEKVSDRAYRGSLEVPGSIQLVKPSPTEPMPSAPSTTTTTTTATTTWRSRIVSWSMLFKLIIFFFMISTAMEVQRLRADLAFFADEARDLRLYGFPRAADADTDNPTGTFRDIWEEPGGVPEPPIWDKVLIPVRPDPPIGTANVESPAASPSPAQPSPVLQESSTTIVPPATASPYPMARVVKATWGAWSKHPA
ncbi:uncharacterized protein LOC62_01G000693 [Vanrija pseudolonga]|uniref:Uncharacterized protein n=1 Tax=Vanrija pseudolonga TaxID=143232 RepID=A0AAF0Y3S5_9TREE|nr:hypothetical protein LOC62_01G000693 [Vanrija pseudolonga]